MQGRRFGQGLLAFWGATFFFFTAVATSQPRNETRQLPSTVQPAPWIQALSLDSAPRLFYTPSETGRQAFADLMYEAKTSLRLYMYRMTDTYMIAGLKKAAERGVKVQVLLDGAKLKDASMQKTLKSLTSAGVLVQAGSDRFTMSHAKTLVMDETKAIVSSMNLTWTFKDSRGFGLVIDDRSAIQEIVKMFDVDWKLGANEQVDIPTVTDANLIWTPANSEAKLIDLTRAATEKIEILVENLGATPLMDELIAAVGRGVTVNVIVPLCTTSMNPLHNTFYTQKLLNGKVNVRHVAMPHSEDQPYSHAKMMAVDGKYVYLGSQNFSRNSLQNSRELGIIVRDEILYRELIKIWDADWKVSVPAPKTTGPETCPRLNFGPKVPRANASEPVKAP